MPAILVCLQRNRGLRVCSRRHGQLVQIWPARTNKTSVGAGHARDISYACREMQG